MKNSAIDVLKKEIYNLTSSNKWLSLELRRKGIPYPYSPKDQTKRYKKEYRGYITDNRKKIKEMKTAIELLTNHKS